MWQSIISEIVDDRAQASLKIATHLLACCEIAFSAVPPWVTLRALARPIMTADACYYWVVICKNHAFHNQQNRFFGHKIPLGETDSFSALPVIDEHFVARCDDCGREYSYKSSEVLRLPLEYRYDLVPHPLFL